MTKISEILTLDLKEDIKNVIDLEDSSQNEIQQEIESYIVTEGIGRHLDNFISQFTSNIKETGVWLSGFYGSGKSYFGKMLGYIIDNPVINGTPARERFIPRLKGVSDESLIENAIRKLDSISSRVIFLDIAKQNTDRGLAFTLFSNLLKNLGFRDDIYGYMEFDFYIDGKLDEFKKIVQKNEKQKWDELKTKNKEVAKTMRRTYMTMGHSEKEYEETKEVYGEAVQNFSAGKFKETLKKYLAFKQEETLVFVFDEASEAISQNKFTLLDLEGISEALSSISKKVWTIAIAQEKLDDVVNNTNINRSQLIKVTDRFKTKIHLESTEVDVIIQHRLLHKTETGYQDLADYHKKNEGQVLDATNLKSSFPTKTKNVKEFATYYPFHKYQFDILQKFLFSSNALVATQIAARGMIITAFDVLRKQMREEELYLFTTGHAICSEAQTAPPIGIVNKYDTAKKILNEINSPLDGEKLLKTIHLLADSDVVSATIENITKSYISDITTYYKIKPTIEDVLPHLLEAKVLLLSNHQYKITSDEEGKLLEEMHGFEVELFKKKRELINYIKDYKIFVSVATYSDGPDTFKFSVLSDQDDELTVRGNRQLGLRVYSLFNISENRQEFVERLKLETQSQKDLITMVPDNTDFHAIDKLIGEVCRYAYMKEKYASESDPRKQQIIRDFSIIREEKKKELQIKIENAYKNASLIYMFEEHLLNADSFKGTISDIQRKLIKNIYTKRLSSQLSEGLVPKIFSSRKEALSRLFSSNDFSFFDSHGNFTGDHLKIVEEINAKIKARYMDGKTLETELSGAPWGYAFGTIASTLAALFRAGRLSVKYNGETWFSHEQNGIRDAFTNATRFRSASFKSITATLSAAQKNDAVQLLMDLEIEKHTDRKVDWSTSDFDLADSIRYMADQFIGSLKELNEMMDRFESLFPTVVEKKEDLYTFTGKITENNYIEKVEYLLANSDSFKNAIQTILKTKKFIRKQFSKVNVFKQFTEAVADELKKADRTDLAIQEASDEFTRLYNDDMVKNFGGLQEQAQIVKDNYFKLIKNAADVMTHQYELLAGKVDADIRMLKKKYPESPNTQNLQQLEKLKRHCTDRIIKTPELDYSIHCKNCGYSLSDIMNYTSLALNKDHERVLIRTNFILESPTEGGVVTADPNKEPRKIQLHVENSIMTVREFKSILTDQLKSLAVANPDEKIKLEVGS